jgi:hypothetical protein
VTHRQGKGQDMPGGIADTEIVQPGRSQGPASGRAPGSGGDDDEKVARRHSLDFSIVVEVPLRAAYDQWTPLRGLPPVHVRVKRAERAGDALIH